MVLGPILLCFTWYVSIKMSVGAVGSFACSRYKRGHKCRLCRTSQVPNVCKLWPTSNAVARTFVFALLRPPPVSSTWLPLVWLWRTCFLDGLKMVCPACLVSFEVSFVRLMWLVDLFCT